MKPNELRIGNLVRAIHPDYNEKYLTVESIDIDSINIHFRKYDLSEIKSIPITEEWLLNLGFMETDSVQYDGLRAFEIPSWGRIIIRNNKLESDEYYFLDGLLQDIYYIHQLQNLYFALTGEELEIKQP